MLLLHTFINNYIFKKIKKAHFKIKNKIEISSIKLKQ